MTEFEDFLRSLSSINCRINEKKFTIFFELNLRRVPLKLIQKQLGISKHSIYLYRDVLREMNEKEVKTMLGFMVKKYGKVKELKMIETVMGEVHLDIGLGVIFKQYLYFVIRGFRYTEIPKNIRIYTYMMTKFNIALKKFDDEDMKDIINILFRTIDGITGLPEIKYKKYTTKNEREINEWKGDIVHESIEF